MKTDMSDGEFITLVTSLLRDEKAGVCTHGSRPKPILIPCSWQNQFDSRAARLPL